MFFGVLRIYNNNKFIQIKKVMRIKGKLMLLIAGFTFLSWGLNSCDTNNQESDEPDAQSAEDDARGAYVVADAFALGNDTGGDTGGKAALEDTLCAIITRTGDLLSGTITIDFDSCTYNERLRDGIVNVAYERVSVIHPRAVNTTITFTDYYIDGVKVEGTITSTIQGDSITPSYTINASNMVLTFPDSKTITWSSNRTYTMVQGFSTITRLDNVIEMSGTSEGVNRAGIDFSTVHDAIRIENICKWPVSGTNTITSDKGTTVIDFGNGTCDREITVTNNGMTVVVYL